MLRIAHGRVEGASSACMLRELREGFTRGKDEAGNNKKSGLEKGEGRRGGQEARETYF